MGYINRKFMCISDRLISIKKGDVVTVTDLDMVNDSVTLRPYGSPEVQVHLETFYNSFIFHEEDEQLYHMDMFTYTPPAIKCTCGTHITYGRMGTEQLHSSFCELAK
jgi:hypothetical protein